MGSELGFCVHRPGIWAILPRKFGAASIVDAAAPQTSGDPMAGAECLQEFARSLDRCHADPRFLQRFYERFVAASPRVRELFRHTDFDRQIAVLRASLYTMMHASGNSILASSQVDIMGGRHARLGVTPDLYDLWLECLLATVAESDPEYSPAVERAWRDGLGPGIARMKACDAYTGLEPPAPSRRSATSGTSGTFGTSGTSGTR